MSVRRPALPASLSHIEGRGPSAHSRMIDIGPKPIRARSASARARIVFPPGLVAGVLAGRGPKGALTEIARAAGCLAAKRTSELIPMCHALALDHLEISFEPGGADAIEIRCRAACRGRTGVEMEALVGAAVAALTVYDMTKALDPAIRIEALELVEKRGGKHGLWRRPLLLGLASVNARPAKRTANEPGSRRAKRRA